MTISPQVKDLAERVGATAAEAFLATWIVTAQVDVKTAAIAGGAGLAAAAKFVLVQLRAWQQVKGDPAPPKPPA